MGRFADETYEVPGVFYTVYSSNAVRDLSGDELADLVAESRRRNARSGLTGMLLYKNRRFMQALEGEEVAVRALLQKISADPRHFDFCVLDEGFTDEREFGDSPMGFELLDGRPSEEEPAESGEQNASARDFLEGGRAWRYLKLFRLVRA